MKRKSAIKEFWIHIIFWVCLFSFPISASYIEFGELQLNMLYRMLLNPILLYVNYLVLVPYLLLRKKIFLYILVSISMLLSFNFLVNFIAPMVPFARLEMLLESNQYDGPKNLPQGLRKMPFVVANIISLAFFLLGGVLRLTKDFYQRDKITREIKVESKETELQFLRAQLNPHFLFNSLNSIYSMVRNNSKDAPDAVVTLSELMRYMIYEAKEDLVPLSKEINYIKNYVNLQLYRLSNSENVRIKISGEYNDKKIPPLLLIPFVENAFKYGTDFKGKTYVDIKMQIFENSLFFSIKNGIGSYRKNEMNSGIGLTNIKNRLQLLFPDEHVLKTEKNNGFYHVQLELNL